VTTILTTTEATETPCEQATLALPWLLNGSLEPAERRAVREHLLRCPQCRAEVARTREALALFTAVAATPAEPKRAAIAAASRGRVLRRLSWAAMIAAVLSAAGGTWLVGTWMAGGPGSARTAQRVQPPAPEPTFSTPTRIAAVSPAIASEIVATTKPLAGVAAPTRTAGVARPRRPAGASRPAPSTPQVISMTSFESGMVAPLANGTVEIVSPDSSKISTVDFENGKLVE
jgi:hypothetical protein